MEIPNDVKKILSKIPINKTQKKYGTLEVKPITSDQRFYFVCYNPKEDLIFDYYKTKHIPFSFSTYVINIGEQTWYRLGDLKDKKSGLIKINDTSFMWKQEDIYEHQKTVFAHYNISLSKKEIYSDYYFHSLDNHLFYKKHNLICVNNKFFNTDKNIFIHAFDGCIIPKDSKELAECLDEWCGPNLINSNDKLDILRNLEKIRESNERFPIFKTISYEQDGYNASINVLVIVNNTGNISNDAYYIKDGELRFLNGNKKLVGLFDYVLSLVENDVLEKIKENKRSEGLKSRSISQRLIYHLKENK